MFLRPIFPNLNAKLIIFIMISEIYDIDFSWLKRRHLITQTCPCNIQRFLKGVKMIILRRKKRRYFSYFVNHRLFVHTGTLHLCLRAKIRKSIYPSRKHLRTKVTPDFHLTYSKKWGKSGVGIKMIKMDNFFDISP